MTPDWDELLVVGRIARTHGLVGHLVVDVDSDFADERFAPGARVYVASGGAMRALDVESVRFHRGRPIVRFVGIDSIEAAEAIGRGEVRAPARSSGNRPSGWFYHHELQGLSVVVRATGDVLGPVKRVDRTAGADLLVVDVSGREVLVPFVPVFCREVDVVARRILVDLPEGLVDVNG